jgi:hypothetical protein
MSRDLDKDNLPLREGVYLVKKLWGDDKEDEIDVYKHPIKGLCCFADDFGSSGTEIDGEINPHVSVQFTGLEFISRVRNL